MAASLGFLGCGKIGKSEQGSVRISAGFCGYGPDYCGKGCQSTCERKSDCNPGWDGSDWSKTDKCPLNVCCSKHGFCGYTDQFCNEKEVMSPSCSPGDTPVDRLLGYYESWSTAKRSCYAMGPEKIPWTALESGQTTSDAKRRIFALTGNLSLHYARWQWFGGRVYGAPQGPLLELAYWIGPEPGVETHDAAFDIYRDMRANRGWDRWVVFHLHVNAERPWLRSIEGRTYMGSKSSPCSTPRTGHQAKVTPTGASSPWTPTTRRGI
ncbi:hypothetical protein G6O67_001165 [Ophiocordyceps sinensis]|uniref:Chitin-binding type-1 domain-containing protein n=1 Tax=Ophiocordyceps sinensis TaxID=72228 RepID=A0A8H4V8U0_9HYPO|nr:hypothetical protein G6O67_001165 [Ophiocordyceps sinensis]